MATQTGSEAAAEALAKAQAFLDATATDTGVSGIQTATVDGEQGALSSINTSTDSVNLSGDGHIDTIVLTGSSNLNATGDQHNNFLVGNDGDNHLHALEGNDTVVTGGGEDTITLGDGNDTIIINGNGNKAVDGGAGDDCFVILPGQGSHSTFTGLNIGDRLTVTVPDGNANGDLDFGDVELSGDDNSLTYHLANGTSFTLDGVALSSATSGSIKYAIVDNEDGTWTVDLTG